MKTLFTQENMKDELPIDGDKDAVLLIREDDFYLHLPGFEDGKCPKHIKTAITIATCLYHGDADFTQVLKDKFAMYGQKVVDSMENKSSEVYKDMVGEPKG